MNETLNKKARFISHEIKNQLSVIDVYTKVIQKTCENNEKINDATKTIFKSLENVTKLLDDFKNLTTQDLRVYNLNEVLLETFESLKEYGNLNGVELRKNLTGEFCAVIEKDKFQNVILNLVKNAIEAQEGTEKKDKFVEINLFELNGKIILRIINNGKKIDKKDQENIFKEGFTTKEKGSGLGLYICKQALNEQGCDLKLLKSNESYTVFEITIG